MRRSVVTELQTTKLDSGSEILYEKFRKLQTHDPGMGLRPPDPRISVAYFFAGGAAGAAGAGLGVGAGVGSLGMFA